MIKLNQEICHYLLNHNISIAAGYLPSVLSIIVNRESKKTKTKQNKKNRHFRVSSWSQSFPSGFWTTRFSNNRSICFLPMSLTTSIYSLASRSLQSGDRCKPELLNLSVREPVLLLQGKETLISPKNIIHLLMVENLLTLATLVGFRKTPSYEGISENASHIITNSRRKDALSNCESSYAKWASWCLERINWSLSGTCKGYYRVLNFSFQLWQRI